MGSRWPKCPLQKIKKNRLNFEGKSWWTLARHRLCPTMGDNILSLVWEAMIARFIDDYDFDIAEFLSWEIGDQEVGGEKSLLAYTCMMKQLCLAMRVQELPNIEEILEATNTTNLVQIRYAANLLAR